MFFYQIPQSSTNLCHNLFQDCFAQRNLRCYFSSDLRLRYVLTPHRPRPLRRKKIWTYYLCSLLRRFHCHVRWNFDWYRKRYSCHHKLCRSPAATSGGALVGAIVFSTLLSEASVTTNPRLAFLFGLARVFNCLTPSISVYALLTSSIKYSSSSVTTFCLFANRRSGFSQFGRTST